MFSCANDDFGDCDFARFGERLAQQDVRLVPALPNLEIIRLIEEQRIDVVNFNEVNDVDCLCRFDVDPGKTLPLRQQIDPSRIHTL